MKSLVVYSGQSGNAGKPAQAAYETLSSEKAIHPVSEAPEPGSSDLIAVGFWLQAGKPDPQSQAYLNKIGGQKVFLFATHGAAIDSDHARRAVAYGIELIPNADIIGQFNRQGEVNPKVLEKAAPKEPPPPWLGDAPQAVGHPDQADMAHLQAVLRECLDEI